MTKTPPKPGEKWKHPYHGTVTIVAAYNTTESVCSTERGAERHILANRTLTATAVPAVK